MVGANLHVYAHKISLRCLRGRFSVAALAKSGQAMRKYKSQRCENICKRSRDRYVRAAAELFEGCSDTSTAN